MILAVSMAVARQVQTLILQEKIEKSGREWGLGWGQTVDGPMPWGALSGSPRVRGHERVFGGHGGGFRAPVVQYLQYMQTYTCSYTLIAANTQYTYTYMQIPADTCGYI